MPYCARCGTNVHLFSFRSFSQVTGRCSKCDSDVEQAIIRFIDLFRRLAADGVLTRSEWTQLEQFALSENLNLNEALHYASPDVSELIRKGVQLATKDNVITENEEKYFNFLLSILAIPDTLSQDVRTIISEYKTAQDIIKGVLPRVQSSLHLWPNEICHLEVPATYVNTDTKTYPRRSGKLWATNVRLVFVSPQRDFDLDWKKVKTVARDGNTLVLESVIKKGNGLYIVDQPVIAEAIIMRLIAMAQIDQSQKPPPRQNYRKENRQEKRSINQKETKTAYDILNVSPNADTESIKLAYRNLAKLYHPDKVASLAPEFQELAELKMKEINDAYQQLLR